MEGYIYLITDTTNGKQYVGQHHYDKEELDPSYHGSGILISKIWNKRPETLKEEYVKTCYSQEELDEWEKYFILTNDTLSPNGYNLDEGGSNGKPSEETRRKQSVAKKGKYNGENHPLYGKHLSEETRRKISESNKGKCCGENNHNFGKHLSDEIKRKISESMKGKCCGKDNSMYGKHHSDETRQKMSKNHYDCSGDKNPNFGKHPSDETRQKMSESRKNGKKSKQVLQYKLTGEFVQEWPSTREAGRGEFNSSSISACCRGKLKKHKGYIWRYKEEVS